MELLVKTPKRRLSAGDVLQHPWLSNNHTAELKTSSRIRKNNSSRELSLFAESAAAVNRVVLQHMSVNLGLWEQTSNLSGLSPPSESRLMQRRKSVHNSQSLQLNRINSAGSKVLSIQVRVRISLHFPVHLVKLLTVLPGPDWPSNHRISVLLTLPVAVVGLFNVC